MQESAIWGTFQNADALNKDVIERFSTLIGEIMKVASEKTYIPDLTVPTIPDGLRVIMHDTTRPLAMEKPEGAETPQQRIEWEQIVNQQLKRWEVRVGITDEAKITGQLTAQELLQFDNGPVMAAGDMQRVQNAGRAFAKAMNAEGLAAMYAGATGTPSGSGAGGWAAAADAVIDNDIEGMIVRMETEGFFPDWLLSSRQARSRLRRMAWVTGSAKSIADYMAQYTDDINGVTIKTMVVTPIIYKDGNGNNVVLFTSVGSALMIDRAAYAAFAQREMTTEFWRNAPAGVDEAIMRKFWLTVVAQPDAGERLTGLGQ